MKNYDVAIIGAGTAGLAARREVEKVTDNYVVIDDGPLGTTCARVGCMPSKVLIEAANLFHSRKNFEKVGIETSGPITMNQATLMTHVRSLRDRFVRAVMEDMQSWLPTHFIEGRASFLSPDTLEVNGEKIKAKSIVIATGSRPIIPNAWQDLKEFLITSDDFFERESLPQKTAIIGLGVIGLELGQALSRIGLDVTGIGKGDSIAGLTDPKLNDYVAKVFSEEFPILKEGVTDLKRNGNQLEITTPTKTVIVDAAFATMGRRPNIDNMSIEKSGAKLDQNGLPVFNNVTFRIKGSNSFLVGDVNADRAILHEAADEGRIAGYNATRSNDQCFKRRTKMAVTFSDPNIASVGKRYTDLIDEKANFVTGTVSFEGQGRAIVKLKEKGLMHVYVEKSTGEILGSEIFAPDGEHLAHMIAWLIEAKINIFESLSLPFYHPVIQEGLRTALRQAASLTDLERPDLEIMRCEDAPVGVFAKGK